MADLTDTLGYGTLAQDSISDAVLKKAMVIAKEKAQRGSLMTGIGSKDSDFARDKKIHDASGNLLESQVDMFMAEGDQLLRQPGQSKIEYLESVGTFIRERTDPVTLLRSIDREKYLAQAGDSKARQAYEVTANAYDWVPDTDKEMKEVKDYVFSLSNLPDDHEDYITPEQADASWRQYEDEQNNIVINAADDLAETVRGLFVDLPIEVAYSVGGALESGYRSLDSAKSEEERDMALKAMKAKLLTVPELLAAGNVSGYRKVGRGFSGFKEAPIEFLMALAGAGGLKNLGRMSKLKTEKVAEAAGEKAKSVKERIVPTGSKADAVTQAAEIIAKDLSDIKVSTVALGALRQVGDARRAMAEGANLGITRETESFLRHLDEGGVPVLSKSKPVRQLSEIILRLFFDPSYKVDVATATKMRELDEGATALAFDYLTRIPNLEAKHPGAARKLHEALTHGSDQKTMNAKYEAINLVGDLAKLEAALVGARERNAKQQIKAIESKIKTIDKRLASELKKVDQELNTLQSLQKQDARAREASFAESEKALQFIPDSPAFEMPAKTQKIGGAGEGVVLEHTIIPNDSFEILRLLEEENAPLIEKLAALEESKTDIVKRLQYALSPRSYQKDAPRWHIEETQAQHRQNLSDINKEMAQTLAGLTKKEKGILNKRQKLIAETQRLTGEAESIPISRRDSDRKFSYDQQQQRAPLETQKAELRKIAKEEIAVLRDEPQKTQSALDVARSDRTALLEQLKDPARTPEELGAIVGKLQTSLKRDIKSERIRDPKGGKLLGIKPKKVATLADFLLQNLANPNLDFTVDGKAVDNIQFYFKHADEGTGRIDPSSIEVKAKTPEYKEIADTVQDTRRALAELSQAMPKVNTAARGKYAPLIADDVVLANILSYVHNPTRRAKFGVDKLSRELERLQEEKAAAAKLEGELEKAQTPQEKDAIFEDMSREATRSGRDKPYLTKEGMLELGFTEPKTVSRNKDVPAAVLEDLRLRSVEELSAMIQIGVTKAADAMKHYTTMSDIVKMNENSFGNREPHRVVYENKADFDTANTSRSMDNTDYVKVPDIKTNDKGGTVFGELSGMLMERRAFDTLRREMRVDDVFSIPSAKDAGGGFRVPSAKKGGLPDAFAAFYRDANQIMKGTMTISNPVYFANTFKGYADLLIMEGVAPWEMWLYMAGIKKNQSLTDAMLRTGYFKDSALVYGTLDDGGKPWNLNIAGIPGTFLKSITDTAKNTATDARTLWKLTSRIQEAAGEGYKKKILNSKAARVTGAVLSQAPETILKDAPTFGGFNAQVAAWMDFNSKRAMMDAYTRREAAARRVPVEDIYKNAEIMRMLAKKADEDMVGYKRLGIFNQWANKYNPAQPFTNWNVRSRGRGLNYITSNPLKAQMAIQAVRKNRREMEDEKNALVRQIISSLPTKKAAMSIAAPDIRALFGGSSRQLRDLWVDLTYMSVMSSDTFSLAPLLSANLFAAPVSERLEILTELRKRYSEDLLRFRPERNEHDQIIVDVDGNPNMIPVEDPRDVEWGELLKNSQHMITDQAMNTLMQTDTGLVRIARAAMGDRSAYDPRKKSTASSLERIFTDVPAAMAPNIYSFYMMGELAAIGDDASQEENIQKYGERRSPSLNLNPGELYAKMFGVPIFREPEEKNERYNDKIETMITNFNTEFDKDIANEDDENMAAFLRYQQGKFEDLLLELNKERAYEPRSDVASPGPAAIQEAQQ